MEKLLEAVQLENESLSAENTGLRKENESLSDALSAYRETDYDLQEWSSASKTASKTASYSFYDAGVAGIILQGCEWSDTALPVPMQSGLPSYVQEADSTYLVFFGTVKNLSGQREDIEYGTYKEVTVNGTYSYTAHWVVQSLDGLTCGYKIDPMEERNCYLFVSIPDELLTDGMSCTIDFGFVDLNQYAYGFDMCTNQGSVTAAYQQ